MRRFIFPAIFLLVAIFGFFWYVQPTYENIQDLQDQTEAYNQTLSQVAQLQNALNDKLAVRDSITGDQLTRLNRILPDSVDTVRFLIELDRIAARHGMSAQNVSFSGAPKNIDGGGNSNDQPQDADSQSDQPYQVLTASFSVSGSYSDVQSLLQDLERSSRIMDVTEFQLSTPSSEGAPAGSNSYKITLRTYWFNPSES